MLLSLFIITKASFAELELPRLLNEVKYSNIQGEEPFCAPKSSFRCCFGGARCARITFFFTTENLWTRVPKFSGNLGAWVLACLLACMLACFFACLLAGSARAPKFSENFGGWVGLCGLPWLQRWARFMLSQDGFDLLTCLLACMLACLHACMLACLHACMPACLDNLCCAARQFPGFRSLLSGSYFDLFSVRLVANHFEVYRTYSDTLPSWLALSFQHEKQAHKLMNPMRRSPMLKR